MQHSLGLDTERCPAQIQAIYAPILWILMAVFVALGMTGIALADNLKRYQSNQRLRSEDYMLKSFDEKHDAAFDGNPKIVDMNFNLGISSDCGNINFENTMKATLSNLLDAKYFGDVGKNIVASSPLLLACYASPTWCAILKHSQISADLLSQMRLDQCAMVDKYTDSRSEDYYRERQSCVHSAIKRADGNLETAMERCDGGFDATLASWGGKSGGSGGVNKLVESSAKWAGLTSEEASRVTDLTKAFVGDTVLSKGSIGVEYGSRRKPLTPESHLKELQADLHKRLCEEILVKATSGRFGYSGVDDKELRELSKGLPEVAIDRDTVDALRQLPPAQRRLACKKLSDTTAVSIFTRDVNRSMDVLTVATQNPNLPPGRKEELEAKRRSLKESIDLTLELQRQRNEPLREVLREIHEQGEGFRGEYTRQALREDESAAGSSRARSTLTDCSDGVLCGKGG
ncbi:MAG: hypothetical protein FJ146_15725 [Deltaproteobacteria bacterium]|nr:hypothetical protein [Deltaproteobacteria bacterium]